MFFLSFQEFLTYPLVYISSSDHLSPEVNKVQLQKVQKNLSFSLQVSSRFSSFILSPWPHCQFSCILPGPTSSSSSWHCGAVSQLSLTSRLPPTPLCQMLLAILFPRCTSQRAPCAAEKLRAAGDGHTAGSRVVLTVLPNTWRRGLPLQHRIAWRGMLWRMASARDSLRPSKEAGKLHAKFLLVGRGR